MKTNIITTDLQTNGLGYKEKNNDNIYAFNEPNDYEPDYDDIYEPDDGITYDEYHDTNLEADSYFHIEYYGYLNEMLEGNIMVKQILRTMGNKIIDSIGKNCYESLLFVISEEISRLNAAKKEFQIITIRKI
jgi:hypothetical protein